MIGRPKRSRNLLHISLSIEEEDLTFLDKSCKKLNKTRTMIIATAIRNPNTERVLELEGRCKALQAEIEQLTPKKTFRLSI